jgi:hypothetical protein
MVPFTGPAQAFVKLSNGARKRKCILYRRRRQIQIIPCSKSCSVMVPTMEEDGTVASIISLTLWREASIEYEPY